MGLVEAADGRLRKASCRRGLAFLSVHRGKPRIALRQGVEAAVGRARWGKPVCTEQNASRRSPFLPAAATAQACAALVAGDHSERLQNCTCAILHPLELVRTYEEEGIRILLAQNVRSNFHDLTAAAFMHRSKRKILSKNRLAYGDVCLTRSGANYGQAASWLSNDEVYACADLLVIKPSKIRGPYLATYFNSIVGRILLDRGAYGMAQPHIAPAYLKDLWVPRFRSLESKVVEVVEFADTKRRECARRLDEASTRLLSAIDLADWLPHDPQSYHRGAEAVLGNETFTAGRFDAEYHAPHVQQLIARLSADGLRLRDVAHWRKERFVPRRRKPFHYIEIGDLTADGLAGSTGLAGDEIPDRAQWHVRAGDVVSSTVRPIRRLSALVRPEQDGYVCSSGFCVLAPHAVPAEVLLTYLRLPVFCELMNLHTTASMYPAIAATDLLALPFAPPPAASVNGIVASVRAAHAARQQARHLLDRAKRAVEIAIEQNEAAALELLD